MSTNIKNNKIYWYLIILLALFILVLFTREQFTQMQVKLDEVSINEMNEQESRNRLSELNKIQSEINQGDDSYENYLVEINEDEIVDYIYWQIEEENLTYNDWITIVRNLSISKWDINEIGFNEATVNLSLRVPSEQRMMSILNFLTSEDSDYKFYIDSFEYQKVSEGSSFNINIPLKIFYK